MTVEEIIQSFFGTKGVRSLHMIFDMVRFEHGKAIEDRISWCIV
jgi:hypothetical protein